MARKKKAWVITVDMGYGHQRASYPLKDIAYERIIIANSDTLVSEKEKRLWKRSQSFYEAVSRFTSLPLVGNYFFNLYDKFQAIADFYPNRDLSKPNLQALFIHRLIRKQKLGASLMSYIRRFEMPIVTTFFIPALAADFHGLKDIFCVVTDTDINRSWVPKDPKHTKITYLAPCNHTVKRLKQYGVPEEKIIMTGFPLPKENLGGKDLRILKRDLGNRLPNLDPERKYLAHYERVIKAELGAYYKKKSNHKLTITIITGGAGAQRDIGLKALRSLKKRIANNEVRINLVAGTRLEIAEYFRSHVIKMGLEHHLGRNINIIFAWAKSAYFKSLSYALHTTDILWSKPSEISFYTALGIPIIIAPPIGAHEHYNRKWLRDIGSGFPQEDPDYTDEWLSDWLESGRLAEAAFEGYMETPNMGTYDIEKVVFSRKNL